MPNIKFTNRTGCLSICNRASEFVSNGAAELQAIFSAANYWCCQSLGERIRPHLRWAAIVYGVAFLGLCLATGRGALFRAVIEGLAMQARMVLDGMVALTGHGQPREIRVIGGGSRNRLLLSVKANVFAARSSSSTRPKSTALGAALLGGIAAGLFPSLDAALRQLDRRDHVVAQTRTWASTRACRPWCSSRFMIE